WQRALRQATRRLGNGWESRQVATQIPSPQIRTGRRSRILLISRNTAYWNWSMAGIGSGPKRADSRPLSVVFCSLGCFETLSYVGIQPRSCYRLTREVQTRISETT